MAYFMAESQASDVFSNSLDKKKPRESSWRGANDPLLGADDEPSRIEVESEEDEDLLGAPTWHAGILSAPRAVRLGSNRSISQDGPGGSPSKGHERRGSGSSSGLHQRDRSRSSSTAGQRSPKLGPASPKLGPAGHGNGHGHGEEKEIGPEEEQLRMLHQLFGPEYAHNRQFLISVFLCLIMGVIGGCIALTFFNAYTWGSNRLWNDDHYKVRDVESLTPVVTH